MRKTYPNNMINYLKGIQKIKIVEKYKGIYYVENDDIPIQIIVTSRISKTENKYITALTKNIKDKNQFQQLIEESLNNYNNPLYELFAYVLAISNTSLFMEVLNMGGFVMDNHTEKIFNELVVKFHLDEKWVEKGIIEGKKEGIKEGEIEGKIKVLLKLLNKKFGTLTNEQINIINNAKLDNLEKLAENIFDVNTMDEAICILKM